MTLWSVIVPISYVGEGKPDLKPFLTCAHPYLRRSLSRAQQRCVPMGTTTAPARSLRAYRAFRYPRYRMFHPELGIAPFPYESLAAMLVAAEHDRQADGVRAVAWSLQY